MSFSLVVMLLVLYHSHWLSCLCIIPYLDILFHCESILIGCMFVAIGAGLGT